MRFLLALPLLFASSLADAQLRVVSPSPDKVEVSIYRDPQRGEGGINPRWPGGFALITEMRTFDLPAGESVIRFEGVADSIISESAIVTGLPGGVAQKNRDTAVLSPAALVDFAIGKRVHVKRTDRKTGVVREEEAIVRAGPDEGLVIESATGVEALRCSGLPETLIFDSIPENLSDKPVLSVLSRSDRAQRVTVSLSYLAAGFDWAANYVVQLAPDGTKMDLFAWATMANGTGQSFVRADTNALAGKLNKKRDGFRGTSETAMLSLDCWPMGTTSDVGFGENFGGGPPPPPPPPMALPSPPIAEARMLDVVVTASRVRAQQEELGDLKLYRIPEPVTVAARGQKQVAMIDRKQVPIEQLLSFRVPADGSFETLPARRLIRTKNEQVKNLGLALPSGAVALFTANGERVLLSGEAKMRDLAVGEEVELETGAAPDIRMTQTALAEMQKGRRVDYRAEITNASASPQTVEVIFELWDDAKIASPSQRLGRKNGLPLWRVTIPANDRVTLDYQLRRPRAE